MKCSRGNALEYMGYVLDRDFEYSIYPDGTEHYRWLSQTIPEPSQAEVDEAAVACTRQAFSKRFDDQIPNASVSTNVRDPHVEKDIARAWAAASDKEAELDETDDADLDAFDPTLDVATPQDDTVGYSELAITILEVDPWAGAPDDTVGWIATLRVEEGLEAQGGEARLSILSPAADGPLPFVQDATDLRLWTLEARDGYKWSDPNATLTAQLRWGSGSVPVTGTLTCNGLYDRASRIVRYGLPEAQGNGGRRR